MPTDEQLPEDQALWVRQTEQLGEKLAASFRPAVTALLTNNMALSPDQWTDFLLTELGPAFLKDAKRYLQGLRLSGFRLTPDEIDTIANAAVVATLSNAQDVLLNLRTARGTPAQPAITADGRWTYTSMIEQSGKFITSAIRVMRDRLDEAGLQRQLPFGDTIDLNDRLTGFSGRRQLIASTKGRRSAINLAVEDTPGAGWIVPARPDLGLPEYHMPRPRFDIATPFGIKAGSGSTNTVRWEFISEDGTAYYVGPRGAVYDSEGRRTHVDPFPKTKAPANPFPSTQERPF